MHASATSAGLQRSLDLLAPDGTVLDLSWYGDTDVHARPGRRLPLAAPDDPGQPGRAGGRLATGTRGRPAERLALALDLLRDDAFDALLTGESAFAELPAVMTGLTSGRPRCRALCHSVTYEEG